MAAPSECVVSVASADHGTVHRQCAFGFPGAPDGCAKTVPVSAVFRNNMIININKSGTLRAETGLQFCIFVSGEFS
jgi:hypothetical protein